MDLSDAALRERAIKECPNADNHQPGAGCMICFMHGGRYIALRDAARAECLGVPADLARSGAAMFAKLPADEMRAFNEFVRIARAEQREAILTLISTGNWITRGDLISWIRSQP